MGVHAWRQQRLGAAVGHGARTTLDARDHEREGWLQFYLYREQAVLASQAGHGRGGACLSTPASWSSTKRQQAQVMSTPITSITTWMLVPGRL